MNQTEKGAQHSPGPWRIEHEEPAGVVIESERDGDIAAARFTGDAGLTRANAALIAAAPEMYDVLRDLREACTEAYKSGRIAAEPFVRAGNVLAKAGQS